MNRILSKLKALTIVEVNLKSVWIASSPTTQHDNQEPARTMLSHWSCLPPSFSLCAPLPTLFHPHIHYLLCVFETSTHTDSLLPPSGFECSSRNNKDIRYGKTERHQMQQLLDVSVTSGMAPSLFGHKRDVPETCVGSFFCISIVIVPGFLLL